jgi:hypothetical protein
LEQHSLSVSFSLPKLPLASQFMLRACLHFGFAGENWQLKVLAKRFMSSIAALW